MAEPIIFLVRLVLLPVQCIVSHENRKANRKAKLRHAAAQGDTATALRQVGKGIRIDAADENGNTALHLAAAAGQLGTAQALVKAGASLAARNRLGQTPLDVAAPAVRQALPATIGL